MQKAAILLGVLGGLAGIPGLLLQAAPLDSDPVVIRIGQQDVRRSAIEARLRDVPRYQLRTYGATDSEAVRAFTETVVARDALLDAAVEAQTISKRPDVTWAVRRTLANALVASLEEAERRNLTEAALRHEFESRRDEYRSPERLLLWRIVVSTREEALAIIDKVRGRDGLAIWSEIARESSEDRTNHLRGGNLGFVEASGQTEWPQLRVDPAIFRAAVDVPDGTVVPSPVALGDRFCVVWRRGSTPSQKPEFETVRARLARSVLLVRRDRAVAALLAGLRTAHLSARNAAPTAQLPPMSPLELRPTQSPPP